MNFLTKNQVVTKLSQLADKHLQVHGFGYGDKSELETEIAKTYTTEKGLTAPNKLPYMWVTPIVAEVVGGSIFYNFEIIVGDLVKKDKSNLLEVESDTLLICLDILSKLDDETYEWALAKQSTIQPFKEKWDSEFTGHTMSISLEFMFAYDYCQVPFIQPDADVAAFLAATGIEAEVEIDAITTLVTQLKENGLWNRMYALYPFVGGTAHTHSFNLKNPNQYKISWSPTGVTHNSNGITGNGTTGYGDTGFVIPLANQNNLHISVYVRNDVISKCAIGCLNVGVIKFTQIYPRLQANSYYFEADINQNQSSLKANENSTGFYIANRITSSSNIGYKNNIKEINEAINSLTPPSSSISLLARKGLTVSEFSNFNLAFGTIGYGLNETEANALFSIVKEFEITLGRFIT